MKKLLLALSLALSLFFPVKATTIHGCPQALFNTGGYDGLPVAMFAWSKDVSWNFAVSGQFTPTTWRPTLDGLNGTITQTYCSTGAMPTQAALGFQCGGFSYTPQGSNIAFSPDRYWDASGNYANAPYGTCRDDVGGPQPSWTYDYSWGLQMSDSANTPYVNTDTTEYTRMRFYEGSYAAQLATLYDICLREIDFDLTYPTSINDDQHTTQPIVNSAGYFADIPSACRLSHFTCTSVVPGWPNANYLHCSIQFADVTQGGGGPCCRS